MTARHSRPQRFTALLFLALAACGAGGAASLPAVDVSPVAAADPGSTLPATWVEGPFAEIYVRGYRDSDGDGVGDLRGLTERLDYLQALGVSGIWLMPVTASQDHDHGYAVTDYRAVEPDYGSLADLDALLAAAHARGIGVILDYVMNHSAYQNPLFVNARSGAGNPYRGFYVWSATHPAGWSIYGRDPWYAATTGWYFAAFWDQMPEFDLLAPTVLAYHQDNLRFWLNRGVDGFRFDAVGNLVENGPAAWENQPEDYAIMGAMQAVVSGYQRRFMVCEDPGDPWGMAQPSACGHAFAFGHQTDLVAASAGNAAAIQAVASYPLDAPTGMATLVSNHDTFAGQRLWDQVAGDAARYRLAAATYLLQPGVPFIYYGEEIGLAGAAGLTGDPKLRAPMSWTGDTVRAGFTTGWPFRALSANVTTQNVAGEEGDPGSLLAFYRTVIALRRARPSLARGDYVPTVAGSALAFTRTLGAEGTLVVLNYGAGSAAPVVAGLPAGATLQSLYPAGGAPLTADAWGRVTCPLAGRALAVWSYAR